MNILHILTLISSFLRFCHVPSFGTYSSVFSRCRNLCVYLYVLGQLVMFSDFTDPGDVLWGPAAYSCMVTDSKCSQSALCVGCVVSSVAVGLTAVSVVLGGADRQPD